VCKVAANLSLEACPLLSAWQTTIFHSGYRAMDRRQQGQRVLEVVQGAGRLVLRETRLLSFLPLLPSSPHSQSTTSSLLSNPSRQIHALHAALHALHALHALSTAPPMAPIAAMAVCSLLLPASPPGGVGAAWGRFHRGLALSRPTPTLR